MKVAIVFVLLFATVLCRPAKKISDSGSDSSEEVVRRPAAPAVRKQTLVAPKHRPAPVKKVQKVVAAPAAGSDESTETSEENQGVEPVKELVKFKAVNADPNPPTEAPPVNNEDSEGEDDDDDDHEGEEKEDEEDESTDSDSESGESSTPAPGTLSPAIVTEEPLPETTMEPILPTIVTDTDAGRGDSLGGYPGDYKSVMYVEEKSYHKVPVSYKSYEVVGKEKKTGYDMTEGNEVEKLPKVYKVQIQPDLLEEDTSTPEVESQGLDVSSGTSQDQDMSARQAPLPEEASATIESSSTPEEEEEESASAESEDEESQSSEEATATPGAADDDSDESDESEEEGAGPDVTTDMPAVVTAK
ncbi:osteopontin isoform X3 [Austrofundulus limnaeus]|uniref:Osteopontin isoform X3 n=1 Tax=Austrofundulus limnaeus TaxID=52670 RepID=A0A2I4CV96_AUSLI|nr:PREDICTED: nucleolin-like isoform X3 [Austrofundulus limnaeus]